MDVTIPTPQTRSFFAAVTEAAAPESPGLGALPNWNLADLYKSPTAPEIEQDLKRASSGSAMFPA